ncbi:ATP-binding cassette domain-containing protein [Mammaliicoccus sciuri]|uniref:ATP-binding cassette domain-containing protein n=1 Tax=Mammaliicoccus sciuri TaxID=1296 RepID=UPI00378E432C
MSNVEQKNNSVKRILNVQDVSIFDGDHPLIQSISLSVNQGDFHCIIGESGSGKSLLTRTILNMKHRKLHYLGNIDIDLNKTDAVFQDVHSNMFQNITLAKQFKYLFEASQSKLSVEEQYEEILKMMKEFGLENGEALWNCYPFELSGGMAQRVAFIMALIRRPKCLILDEPTTALDKENCHNLMQYLGDMYRQNEMTVIFVTHDINLVKAYATHISIMKDGQIIESGDKETVLNHPKHEYARKLMSIARRREKYA